MSNEEFNKFQLAEYEFIAEAHFETIKQVTTFFRYYLIFLAAPAIILGVVDKDVESLEKFFLFQFPILSKFISLFFIFISVIGLLLCLYIINLRMDAILYARTINGIRKYFFENKIFTEVEYEKYFRVLTKNITQPSYLEWHLFFPVVFTFAFLDAIYLGFGLYLWPNGLFHNPIIKDFSILGHPIWAMIVIEFVLIHMFLYVYQAYYRDNLYMRSHKIGIDIDGVLNDHRTKFCDILENNENYCRLSPNEINKIPVRFIAGKNITEIDELKVFNNANYWEDMPPISDNFQALKKINKQLGYKIYIFTNRPWPDWHVLDRSGIDQEELNILKNSWNRKNMKETTIEWLRRYDIPFSKRRLIIEKGNLDVSDFSFHLFKRNLLLTKNRYQVSRRKNFRFFVDDTPAIVRKISNFCEFVFVINQPYNLNEEFPANVIRVNNWGEIYEQIKSLS